MEIMKRWMVPISMVVVCGLAVWAEEEKGPEPFDDGVAAGQGAQVDPFDPTLNLPKYVQVQVEFVEMAHEDLTKLLFLSNPESSDATALRMTVAEMVKKEQATVLETMMVVARSGEKAVSEGISEFIYPTEYEPPEIPNEVDLPDKEGGLTLEDVKGLWALRTPATPTSFETRNLGSTFEIAPLIGENGRIIDLNFAPEIVWHSGNTVWVETKDGLGNVSKIEMPRMYKLGVTTAITCIDGQYNLVAVLSPKDQEGITDFSRKVMVFVKCDIMVVKEAAE
jgi:hypothetical protein